MKVKILKQFRDRDTLKISPIGSQVDYEPERAKELAAGRFVELLEAEETEDVQVPEPVIPAEADVDEGEPTGKEEMKDAVEKVEIEVPPKKEIEHPAGKAENMTYKRKKRGRKPKSNG